MVQPLTNEWMHNLGREDGAAVADWIVDELGLRASPDRSRRVGRSAVGHSALAAKGDGSGVFTLFLRCRLAVLDLAGRNRPWAWPTGSDRGGVWDAWQRRLHSPIGRWRCLFLARVAVWAGQAFFFAALKALLALCRRSINLMSMSMSVRPRRFNSARALSANRRFLLACTVLGSGFPILAICGSHRVGTSP